MKGIASLTGTVKHYDWGGRVFIPKILGEKTESTEPNAEYWLGVHPQAGSELRFPGEEPVPLRDYINSDPVKTLGARVAESFGNLPYLLKALDVQDMLSIQVHPSRANAVVDFEREEKSGIAITDPKRNYKDKNHKPELMVAMGEFWLLHGFKPEDKLQAILRDTEELQFLLPIFETSSYQGVYEYVMNMPQEEVNERLQGLSERIIPLYKEGKLNKSSEDFWAARAGLSFSKTDRGIFSVYLFNLVRAQKGDAIFQDAGVPHAYLEGWNVEIMASSDNVLRGGLTNKHIDVDELLKHVICGPTIPNIIRGTKNGRELIYETPAPDFELSGFELREGEEVLLEPSSAEILLLIEGSAELSEAGDRVELRPGKPSAVIFPGSRPRLNALSGSLIYKARVPNV